MRPSVPLLILLVVSWSATTMARLNIYLDQQEVRRLLGLSAELYYIREGVINEYALNFVVPVPAHIQDLFFTWQAIGEKPVPYSIGIETIGGDSDAMEFPSLNISSKGNVPSAYPQVFRLKFPCTGRSSSEVDVHLLLNVTLSEHRKHSNVTQLRFKRKKICLQDSRPPPSAARNESSNVQLTEPETMNSHWGTVYVAVGSAGAFVVIMLSVLYIFYLRRRKAMLQERTYDVPAYCSNANVYLAGNVSRTRGSVGSASYATIASFQKLPLTPASSVFPARRMAPELVPCHGNSSLSTFGSNSEHNPSRQLKNGHHTALLFQTNPEIPAYQVSGLDFIQNNTSKIQGLSTFGAGKCLAMNRSNKLPAHSAASTVSMGSSYDPQLDPGERLKRLECPRFRVTLRNLIEQGTFSKVYSGLFLNPDTNVEGQVLIKTVTELASAAQKTVFLTEGTQMAGLQHRHVLTVIGCCMEANNIPIIVYPWVSRGNLKRFLINCRSGSANLDGQIGSSVRTTLMTQDVVDMAIQAVLAMLYLHRHKIIHQDVAARSCVVDDRLRIKVTDTALSRDLFPDDYHCLGDGENRPIKWMALESMSHKEYSTAADVWSFGVLLWELTTLAQQPYVEVDPFEMEGYLKDDYRLSQPLNCPDELFAVMACCWIADPKKRPTFLQLLACLQDFHTALGRFI